VDTADTSAPRIVRRRNILLYGLGDIYGGGAFLVIGTLFMFYMTEVVGLSPLLAGFVFSLGKIWDAISDPLMGYLSDRTKSRFGRRRVYFLAGIAPIALSFILLWLPVKLESQAALFAYYSLSYIVFATVITMVMIPYSALAAEMSGDYKVRNSLSGSRLFFSGFSSLIAATVPKVIIDMAAGGQRSGYMIMSIIFGLFFALPWVFVYFGTWESVAGVVDRKENFFKEFLTIFRNRSFRVHILMYIFAYSAMDVLMALFTYYLTYSLRRPELYSIAMGSLMVVQLMAIPVYVAVANRLGKRTAYIIGLSIWAIGMVGTLLLSPSVSVVLVALICAVIGMGTSAGVLIPYTILPNVIDVDELMTGEQRSGIYSGAMTLTRKMVQGVVAMPLIGLVLQGIRFVPNAVQSPETLAKFFAFFIGGPFIFILAGIAAATRFKLSPRASEILAAELVRLRAGGSKADAGADTIAVCEEVSGKPYAECWVKGTV
jgi:oligogalacturonide transporter